MAMRAILGSVRLASVIFVVHAGAPQHDAAEGIGPHFRAGQPRLGQFAWEGDVGREVQVVGRGLLDLGVELARGAIDDVDLVARAGLLECYDDLVHRELQVGRRGDGDFVGVGCGTDQQEAGQQERLEQFHFGVSGGVRTRSRRRG